MGNDVANHYKESVSAYLKFKFMKKLSKLTLRNVNANDVMSDKEMKNVLGGGAPGGSGGGGGIAKGCSDHDKSACFGPCMEIIGNAPYSGECKWAIVEALSYASCACYIKMN